MGFSENGGTVTLSQLLGAESRFWPKIDVGIVAECWPWIAYKNRRGYGKFMVSGKVFPAHRYTFLLMRGPIPEGLCLDHLCRNRACVNPYHLEPVTLKENILRGMAPSAVGSRRTHCPKGHPYSGSNLYKSPGEEHRLCRLCRTLWERSHRSEIAARKKAKLERTR